MGEYKLGFQQNMSQLPYFHLNNYVSKTFENINYIYGGMDNEFQCE